MSALVELYGTTHGIGLRVGDKLELLSGPDLTLAEAVASGMLDEVRARAPIATIALADACLQPPALPGRVTMVGFNYAAHAAEAGFPMPERPLLGGGPAGDAVCAPGDDVVLPADAPTMVDYEAELAIVIGRAVADLDDGDIHLAASAVAGVCVVNDLTARDRQIAAGRAEGGPDMAGIVASKTFPGFKPLGPGLAILPPDEWEKLDMPLTLTVNGETRQAARTSDMVFSIPALVIAASREAPLLPGDVICSGTPAGIGLPQGKFLASGDVVAVKLGDMPALVSTIVSAPQNT